MSRIARTVAEADVGDLLWYQADRWRPGPLTTLPVRKIGRVFVFVGASMDEHTWLRHKISDGRGGGGGRVWGYRDREVQHWLGQVSTIEKRLRETRDIELLRDVAFVLGLPKAPDFSDPEQGR